jgi:hypothetical protein
MKQPDSHPAACSKSRAQGCSAASNLLSLWTLSTPDNIPLLDATTPVSVLGSFWEPWAILASTRSRLFSRDSMAGLVRMPKSGTATILYAYACTGMKG